jgi:integrase
MAWLYKREGSAKYWIGWRANGRQFLKSTGEREKSKAEIKLRDFEFLERARHDGKLTEHFIESLTNKPLSQLSLKSAVTGWLDETKGAAGESTHDRYNDIATQFLDHIGATDSAPLLRDVTAEEIRAFLSKKRTAASASTVNLYRKVLSTFFIRELKAGTIRANPCLQVKRFKDSKGEKQSRRAFTLAEVRTMYDKAPSLFWRYMILGAFHTGLRLGDLVCMKWGAIDFGGNVIRLVTGKTGRPVQIPMTSSLKSVLLEIKGIAGSTKSTAHLWPDEAAEYARHKAKVFSNQFYDEVLIPSGLATPRSKHGGKKGRSAQRDLSGVSFHCFRHTFISTLKITGSSSAIAKELAGHSSDAVNQLYTHIDIDSLAKAVNQLPEVTS